MEEKFLPFLTQMLEISVCELHSDSLWAGRSGDRITVGARVFRTCSDRPWGPPSLLCNGYRVSFLGVKRPAADQKTPSSAEFKERVQLYPLLPPLGLYGPFMGELRLKISCFSLSIG